MENTIQEIERCKKFIESNFNKKPTSTKVSIYSLAKIGGTFTDHKIIKAAIKQIKFKN
jgi:hypothetical protein